MTGIAKIKEQFLMPRTSKAVVNNETVFYVEKEPDSILDGKVEVKEGILIKEINVDRDGSKKEVTEVDIENTGNKRKKKEKGQNKKRPRTVPLQKASDRLCPSVSRNNSSCDNLVKCNFLHDAAKYLENKPKDIDGECVNFKLTGQCNYGLECRFASCHTTSDFKNIIDKEKQNEFLKRHPAVCNSVTKELQILLRKKQFSFPKSSRYLEKLKFQGKATTPTPEPSTTTLKTMDDKNGLFITGNDCSELDGRHEMKHVDFSDKLYLAPLTTVGNLPFRRICKRFGADITCSEMAMSTNLLQGQQSEWALLKRHETEDIFGVQVCGSFPDTMSRCAELLNEEAKVDFIDINIGCPIDLVYKKGGGCALMGRMSKFEQIVRGMVEVSEVPITVKMRTGIYEKNWTAHNVIPRIRSWGSSLVTLHGRSREQRYTRTADWDYIATCAEAARPMPLFGNGDVLSFEDANQRRESTSVSGLMIARGALIKPWIFTEIKEQRHWDISSSERFDILKEYTNYGLEHWGSDHKGVENTRRFLLEWLSFLHRYIPVGVLEVVPQRINERPPPFIGRDDLETLMASNNCKDWIKISEMLLGPVPANFNFLPKHKANSF
eukprot:gene3489-3988_t